MTEWETGLVILAGIVWGLLGLYGLTAIIGGIEDGFHRRDAAARKTARMVAAQIEREKAFNAAQVVRLAGGGGE